VSHVRFGLPIPWRESDDGKGLVALVEDPRCDFCFQEIEVFPFRLSMEREKPYVRSVSES